MTKACDKAADAITFLAKEVASARVAGAEKMRDECARIVATGIFTRRMAEDDDCPEEYGKEIIADVKNQILDRIAALPLPSPVAVQAVEPWVEKVRQALIDGIEQARGCAANHYGEDEPIDGPHIGAMAEALALLPSPTAGE